MVKQINIVFLAAFLLSGCLPDSLKKWNETPAKAPVEGLSVTGPNGEKIGVSAPSGGTAPTSFSYAATSFGFNIGTAISDQTVTFVGEQSEATNTYVFTSYDGDSPTTQLSLSTVGLSLNSKTGTISGTPSSFSAATNFLIKAYHVESGTTLSTNISIAVATDVASAVMYYPQSSSQKLIIKLASVSAFAASGSISSSSGAKGTVSYVDTANSELHVSVTSSGSYGFLATESVDNASSFVIAETTITDVTYAIATTDSISFLPVFNTTISSTEFDSLQWSITPDVPGATGLNFQASGTPTASNGAFTASPPIDSLATTSYTVTVKNIIDQTKQATVRFNVSNAPTYLSYARHALLKVDDFTEFDVGDPISSSGTGVGKVLRKFSDGSANNYLYVKVISGEFKAAESIDHIIPFNTLRTLISTSQLVNAALTLADSSAFAAAENIAGNGSGVGVVVFNDTTNTVTLSIVTPDELKFSPGDAIVGVTGGAETAAGTVLRVGVSTLVVNVHSGTFAVGNDIQIGKFYDSSVGVDSSSGVLTGVGASNSVYIRYVSGTFTTAQSVDDAEPYAAAATTISYIDAPHVTLALTAATGMAKGQDISGLYGNIGVIDKVSGTDIGVQTENGIFNPTKGVDNHNPHDTVNVGTVTTAATRYKFSFYRGEEVDIIPQLTQGDNIVYKLTSGTLPTGLALDTATGIISGTPTQASANQTMTMEARNAVGNTSHSFELEIHEHFSLVNKTADAPSFILHKAGQARSSTNCRITATQLATTGGYLDSKNIMCYLDAGELDLYFNGLALTANVGKGLCEFINIRPYHFYKWQPKVSGSNTTKYFYKYSKDALCVNNCSKKNPDGSFSTVTCSSLTDDVILCDGDHTDASIPGSPNCDTGQYYIQTLSLTDTGVVDGSCLNANDEVAATTTTGPTSCGGKRANCIDGPALDLLTATQMETGMNSVLYASNLGIEKDWTFASPISKSHLTNARLANFANTDNICLNGSYSYFADGWQNYAQSSYYQIKLATPGNAANFTPGNYVVDDDNVFAGVIDSVNSTDGYIVVRAVNGTGSDVTDLDNLDDVGAAIIPYVEPNGIASGTTITAYDNPFRRAQPYYDIDCLNSSYDTIGRIRVVVRDWNRDFDSSSQIDRISPTASAMTLMDNSGTDAFGNSYNNRSDWADDTAATFTGSSCTSTAPPFGSPHSFPEDSL